MASSSSAQPLKLLLLRDRRPGHHHQVEGLALSIARHVPVEIDRIDIRPRWFARGRMRDRLYAWLGDDRGRALKLLFGIDMEKRPRPDVVVASGRMGFTAAALIKRLTGAKFIHCSYVGRYKPEDFDLMLVASPRLAWEPNCALAPIPCTIDPDSMPAPRPLRTAGDLVGASISLLIGGKAKGYNFSDADWLRLADLVAETGAAHGILWSVTTSRRTPPSVADRFQALSQQGKLYRFIDFRKAGPGSANGLYAADAVVVTEDSRSMVAEAMAARRPTIVVRPTELTPTLAGEDIVALATQGGAAIVSGSGITPERFLEALFSVRPAEDDARDKLFAAVAPTLGLAGPSSSTA